MFVSIETNGATHLLVYVPSDAAASSLPALANMLEANTVFVHKSYSNLEQIKPGVMTISLGEVFESDKHWGQEQTKTVIVGKSDYIIGEEFVKASPDVYVSFREAQRSKDETMAAMRNKISYLEDEVKSLKEALAEAKRVDLEV